MTEAIFTALDWPPTWWAGTWAAYKFVAARILA